MRVRACVRACVRVCVCVCVCDRETSFTWRSDGKPVRKETGLRAPHSLNCSQTLITQAFAEMPFPKLRRLVALMLVRQHDIGFHCVLARTHVHGPRRWPPDSVHSCKSPYPHPHPINTPFVTVSQAFHLITMWLCVDWWNARQFRVSLSPALKTKQKNRNKTKQNH